MNKELSLKQRMALEKDILLAERDELQVKYSHVCIITIAWLNLTGLIFF